MAACFEALVGEPVVRDRFDRVVGGAGLDATTRGRGPGTIEAVRQFIVVVEQDARTGLFVGYVPGFPGAHSQASSLDELSDNLREVVTMLLEDGPPDLEAEFAGIQTITV